MTIRERLERMRADEGSIGTPEFWQEYYTEDVVKRIDGLRPLKGRRACLKQVQEFLEGFVESTNRQLKATAIYDTNQISVLEWVHEFRHQKWGSFNQAELWVQRWRDGKIFEELVFITQLEDPDGH